MDKYLNEPDDSFIINNNPKARGFYNNINNKQVQTLQTLKEKLQAEGLIQNISKYNDRFYLRFLRAESFDITKAFNRLSNYFQWREEENVDNVLSFEFPEINELKKLYPHGFHKTDKDGRPIYIDTFGYVDANQLFKITTEERWLRYYIREKEKLITEKFRLCSIAKGKVVEQYLNIIN